MSEGTRPSAMINGAQSMVAWEIPSVYLVFQALLIVALRIGNRKKKQKKTVGCAVRTYGHTLWSPVTWLLCQLRHSEITKLKALFLSTVISATRKMAAERYGNNTSPMIGAFESIRKCLKDVKTHSLVYHIPAKEKNCFVELKDELISCL